MKVSEIMTKNPVCCWPSSSTLSAALLMQETDTGIVPVIQNPFPARNRHRQGPVIHMG
jgi:CBS domain-containing protein